MQRALLITIFLLCPLYGVAQDASDDLLFEEDSLFKETILSDEKALSDTADFSTIRRPTDYKSQFVTIKSVIGTEFQGYVTGPEDSKFGILLLHDRWGFNKNIREWADRFAAKGYRALAIDLFDGRASNKIDKATEIMGTIDPEWAKSNAQAGLRFLATPGRKVVTIGWGFGGWTSFQAALEAPNEVAGTIVMYGAIEASEEQVRKLKFPVLGLFARQDRLVTPAHVAAYEQLMKKSLIIYRSYSYDGDHGFADPLYPAYSKELTDEAWQRVDSFLKTFILQG